MIKVTLDPNWKENVQNSVVEKYVAVEMVEGKVKNVFVNHEDLVNVKVFVINHDVLRLQVITEMQKQGFRFNEKVYNLVVEIMKTTGDDNVESIVKSIMFTK